MPRYCRGIIYRISLNRIFVPAFIDMKKLFILLLVALAGCHSKPTAPFKILKVIKTVGGAKMDVRINSRLSRPQMLAIAARIKSDSSQYKELELDYLLPGNSYENSGGISVYAMAAYPQPGIVTAKDTVKDDNNNLLSFEFIGFTPEKAKQLLALHPAEMNGKTILGKFIDDNTRTVTLVYKDKLENQLYILELDTVGKVVSATAPMEVTHNGVTKLVVTQRGDFCTFKDSLFTMYSIDEPGKPYRALKEGI
jgi:hypothetical protein